MTKKEFQDEVIRLLTICRIQVRDRCRDESELHLVALRVSKHDHILATALRSAAVLQKQLELEYAFIRNYVLNRADYKAEK